PRPNHRRSVRTARLRCRFARCWRKETRPFRKGPYLPKRSFRNGKRPTSTLLAKRTHCLAWAEDSRMLFPNAGEVLRGYRGPAIPLPRLGRLLRCFGRYAGSSRATFEGMFFSHTGDCVHAPALRASALEDRHRYCFGRPKRLV